MPKFLTLLFVSSIPFSLIAEESVSNADLSRKLDLILGKVGGLERRVGKLESDNAEVKKEVKQATKLVQEAKSETNSLQIPKKRKGEVFLFQKT